MNGKVPDTPSAACEEAAGKRPEGCRQAGAKGSEGSTGRRKGAVAAGQARSDQGDRQRYLHPGGEKASGTGCNARRCDPGSKADTRRETGGERSEEHTSELQSLMRISYAVFCLKKKKKNNHRTKKQKNYTTTTTISTNNINN